MSISQLQQPNSYNLYANSLTTSNPISVAQSGAHGGKRCISVKQVSVPATGGTNFITLIDSGAIGPGKITRIWLANGTQPSANLWPTIGVDETIGPEVMIMGTIKTGVPSVANSVNMEVLMGAGFASAAANRVNVLLSPTGNDANGVDLTTLAYFPQYATNRFGFQAEGLSSGGGTTSASGGWFTFDFPFKDSFKLYMANSAGGPAAIWVNIEYVLFDNVPASSITQYTYCRPYQQATNVVYPNAITTLSVSSPTSRGVRYLGSRDFFTNGSLNWGEGRVKINVNGADTWQSSGTEDYYLSCYTWNQLFRTDEAGVTYAVAGSTTQIAAYRFFDEATCPAAAQDQVLQKIYPVGDVAGGASGSVAMFGINFYAA